MKDEKRTKKEIIQELRELRSRLSDMEAAESERDDLKEQLRNLSFKLEERIKELNCLYSISTLRERHGISLEHVLQGIVDIIPPAWQYPEITCARMVLPETEFRTADFMETSWRQVCDIKLYGKRAGTLEVYYREMTPRMDEGPFLEEETRLLEAIGERVGKILEYDQAEQQAKQQERQLIQLDKMVALGTMVSGVAHEINNPNNFIMLNAPVLWEAYRDLSPILDAYYEENGDFRMAGLQYTEMRESIPVLFSGILEGSKRIKNIVNSLKDFARVDTSDLAEAVDINAVIASAITLLGNHIKKSTKRFEVQYGERIPMLKGNFQRLEQVIVNLVQNACEALSNNQEAILLTTSYDPVSRRIIVKVMDEGIGIPEERLNNITLPFNTTKRHNGGVGLGLSVSSGIIKDHEGALHFTSKVGEGTTATITLPVSNGNDVPAVET